MPLYLNNSLTGHNILGTPAFSLKTSVHLFLVLNVAESEVHLTFYSYKGRDFLYLDAYAIFFFILKVLIFKCIHLQKLRALRLEKAVVTQSSTLSWETPWTEGPGRLQSVGSLRVRSD